VCIEDTSDFENVGFSNCADALLLPTVGHDKVITVDISTQPLETSYISHSLQQFWRGLCPRLWPLSMTSRLPALVSSNITRERYHGSSKKKKMDKRARNFCVVNFRLGHVWKLRC